MSFVPVTGPARLLVGEPPREGSIEFTDERRTIVLPIRGALPVLGKVRDADEPHPSVALLAGAALMGLQLVASGRFAPDPEGRHWQVAGLDADDERRIGELARSRAWDGFDEATAEGTVRALLDAVVDTVPRTTPGRSRHRAPVAASAPVGAQSPDEFSDRLQQRIARIRTRARDDRPHLVTISFRIEADEEELVAGAVRLVTQVHAVDNAAHMADASELWAESGPEAAHGFGERARTHAAIALRSAADAWPVLERLLDLRVPDEITLDSDEILSLLDGGAAALDRGRPPGPVAEVPRPRGHPARRAGPPVRTGPSRGAAAGRPVRPAGALRLRVAGLAARRGAERGGDGRAGPHGEPHHQAARQLGRGRLRDHQARPQAADPHRDPRAGAGRDADRRRRHRGRPLRGGRRREPADGPRPAARRRDRRAGRRAP